jgi:hypothetical protein
MDKVLQLLIKQLKVEATSYSCSPLTFIDEGGSKTHHGMMDA